MNDEIKEILDRIETASEIFDCLLKPEECTELLDYITNLQQKIEQYENPDDMTLFYMWLDVKAKDKIKDLQQENERLKEKLEIRRKICLEAVKRKQDYKSRCEKAYSYVDNVPISHYEKGYMEDGILISKRVIKNILQNGSDSQCIK